MHKLANKKSHPTGFRLFGNEGMLENTRAFTSMIKFLLLSLNDFPKFARNIFESMFNDLYLF
jgi:hypothetical protein